MCKRPALHQPSPWGSHATSKSGQRMTCRRNDISVETSLCDLIYILVKIHCLNYFKLLFYLLLEVPSSRFSRTKYSSHSVLYYNYSL